MTDFVNTIDLYGDDVVAGKIVDGTIEEFNDDIIASIGEYAFYDSSTLASVNLPNVTSIGKYAFYSCKALTRVGIPNVTSIVDYTFQNCSTLASVDLTNVKSISTYAFLGCKALASVNLPNVTSMGTSAFASCSNLNVIILGGQSVCTLKSISAFNNTPFAAGGTGGTVYVPQALITQYQNATNWSTLYAAGTCNFVAIEGSEYE